jgi:hypothetical protein
LRLSIETAICFGLHGASTPPDSPSVVVPAVIADREVASSEVRSASTPATTSSAATAPAMAQVSRVGITPGRDEERRG